jgi:hypothetical protein
MSIYDPLTKIPENVLLTNLGQYVHMDKLDITTISVYMAQIHIYIFVDISVVIQGISIV